MRNYLPTLSEKSFEGLIVLGVDPGKATGTALCKRLNQRVMLPLKWEEVDYDTFFLWFPRYHQANNVDLVVVEDFIIRPADNRQGRDRIKWIHAWSAKIIGAIYMWCLMNEQNFVLQQPSERSVQLAKVKELKAIDNRHCRDALAHAWTWNANFRPRGDSRPG